eukprot:Skav212469  [mRNA]  locus=scaffold385:322914:323309:- [translate_table: standard]
MAPAILWVCLLYFAFATLAYRWLFQYVYHEEFDSGGAFWYDLFNALLIGQLLSTLSLLGLATLYGTNLQILVLVPLPFYVLYLALRCWRIGKKSHFISKMDARDADEAALGLNMDSSLYEPPPDENRDEHP